MAHLHILPTDKTSRLYLGDNGNLVLGLMKNSIENKNNDFTNQNIYITSNEEIKMGDWFIDDCESDAISILYKCLEIKQFEHIRSEFDQHDFKDCKKIILTTDQDLIKDGVQSIDDEFLEWFVKNQSCEFVEIKPLLSNNGRALFGYKIIIPKEEHTTILTANAPLRPPVKLLCGDAASGIEPVRISSFNKYFDEQSASAESRLQTAIALLKQTTEYEVLDSFKEKVKQLEIE